MTLKDENALVHDIERQIQIIRFRSPAAVKDNVLDSLIHFKGI